MSLLAEQIPEDDRKFLKLIRIEADFRGPLLQKIFRLAHHGDTGQVTLYVGTEHWHAGIGKTLRKHLQSHGFTRAGSTSNQPVAIAVAQQQFLRPLIAVVRLSAGAKKNAVFSRHHEFSAITWPTGTDQVRRYSKTKAKFKGASSVLPHLLHCRT